MANGLQGALAEAVFELGNPKSKQDFANFLAELDKVKKENRIDFLIVVKKKISETKLRVTVIPAFGRAVDQKTLKAMGLEGADVVSDTSQLAEKFKEFDFSETVSFGARSAPAPAPSSSAGDAGDKAAVIAKTREFMLVPAIPADLKRLMLGGKELSSEYVSRLLGALAGAENKSGAHSELQETIERLQNAGHESMTFPFIVQQAVLVSS
ncbi:MAG: hypothetical protein ACAI44_14900 [Candidatus Sericytochromatia bacterium]